MSIHRIGVGPRMSQAVVHGDTVYLSGTVADKAAGKSVGEQTRDVLHELGYDDSAIDKMIGERSVRVVG